MEIKILALILVLRFFLVAAVTFSMGFVNANNSSEDEGTPDNLSCSGCGNSCSLESNCGLSTCGAVSGKSCGCN